MKISLSKFIERQRGQTLLIVVLVMVVALTVGLSVASKSITSLRTSTEEANSQRALSAAEAGIEQAIRNNVSIANGSLPNNTGYDTSVTEVLGTRFQLNGGNLVAQDDGIDVWLSEYSSNSAQIYNNPWSGNLTILWGDANPGCSNAALEIVLVTGPKATPALRRYAVDPCQVRTTTNRFTFATQSVGTVDGKNFYYQTTIAVTNGLFARIIPLYTNTYGGIIGSVALPSQGSVLVSTGRSGTTQRRITVFQGYPELPSEFFPYSLFSP